MNLFSPWSLDRIVRGIHYRVGLGIAKKDVVAKQRSNESLAQRIRETHTKINIGCGRDKRAGYLNVDTDPAASLDLLLVDGDDSMIPRRHFVEVLARDVLEHIPRAQTLAALLDWADYLADGGKLVLQTSSILGVAAKLSEFTKYQDQHSWTTCLFGNQAHPGDFHFTGFTEVTLSVQLLAAGFRVDFMELRDDWLLYAEATKIENWTAVCNEDISDDTEFVKAACRRALFRDIGERDLEHCVRALRTNTTRKQTVKAMYASPERLFSTAERNGL